MNNQEKDRIECAIRHIESSLDVDPWAVEIAVEAMEKQEAKIIPIRNGDEFATCPNCGHDLMYHREGFCEWCGQKYEMLLQEDGGQVMEELKPCPFCGGEAELYESEAYNLKTEKKEEQIRFFVMCKECTALVCGLSKKVATERWNRRASDEVGL